MKKWILTLCLLLCACAGAVEHNKYEITLLDDSVLVYEGYCEWYADTNIIVNCRNGGDTILWDDVYVAKEIHRITKEVE